MITNPISERLTQFSFRNSSYVDIFNMKKNDNRSVMLSLSKHLFNFELILFRIQTR